MAATPEEFLGQGAFLAVPEPFSPSVFLDLPPTPRPDGGGDPASSDDNDLVLPFISHMLMEEDIDDKFFYQYPDHPALLNAQQPYAQILSDATTSSSSDSAATTNTTLSPSCSFDAAASAEPTWPYDPVELAQLLRSPPYTDMGVGLDDFGVDDLSAVLLPAQDGAAQGFQQSPLPVNSDGSGGPAQGASFAGEAVQSSGYLCGSKEDEHDDTKANITTLPASDEDHGALASAFFGGHKGVNMDMLNRAFAQGMEEAKKFLPANNAFFIDLEATTTGERLLSTDSKPKGGLMSRQVKEEETVADEMPPPMFREISPMFRESSNGRGRKNRHHDEDFLEAETGRSSKQMMQEQEETDAQEMYTELMSCNYEDFLKRMEDLRVAMDSESEKTSRRGGGKTARGRQRADEVVDLRTMLIHCAQAVATGDLRSANEMLKQIKQHSSLRGDATQRLAHCFAEGLEARLAGTGSLVYQSLVSKRTSVVDYLKA